MGEKVLYKGDNNPYNNLTIKISSDNFGCFSIPFPNLYSCFRYSKKLNIKESLLKQYSLEDGNIHKEGDCSRILRIEQIIICHEGNKFILGFEIRYDNSHGTETHINFDCYYKDKLIKKNKTYLSKKNKQFKNNHHSIPLKKCFGKINIDIKGLQKDITIPVFINPTK
jgi:hypothetical protein